MATLADVEGVLHDRLGELLTVVGWPTASPNAKLVDPIGWALRALGYPADLASVTDSDVAQVPDSHLDALLDLAELRTLENLLGNYKLVSTRAGEIDQKFGELGQRLLTMLSHKRQTVAAMHGDKLVIRLGQSDRKHAVLRTL